MLHWQFNGQVTILNRIMEFNITRVYSDKMGKTHFEDKSIFLTTEET